MQKCGNNGNYDDKYGIGNVITLSSYSVHPAHRKLWSGSRKRRTTATHTHRRECGQRVPQLEKGLQKERNLQLTNKINISRIHTNN